MDYWNHVLWSDETKINFGSDGVKRVWRQPGEEYKDKCVLPTVKHGGGSVMVWGCLSAAGTGELRFIEGTMNANMYCDILKQSMIPSLRRLSRRAVFQHDNQLSFTDHIATTARSCRFALYNIRKIRPFLSEQAAQLLVQALVLSRLDYCNALLAGLPACTIKPLQLIQNAAARVVFNEPKKAHVTPLFIRLHWLPIAACIKFKVLMFAYKTTTGTAPIYLNLLVQTYAPSRSLRSASERQSCGAIPKRYQITLTDLFLDCAQLVE